MKLLLLAALWLPAVEAPRSVQGVADGSAFKEAELEKQVVEQLQSDPALRDQLARRIAESKLAGRITEEEDPDRRLAVIRAWIDRDMQSAAQIGLGLARDDASGTTTFQDTVNRSVTVTFVENPAAAKGIFGRLRRASRDATLMRKDQEMSGEEQQEIIKTLFEGKGGMSGKVVTQLEDGKGEAGAVGAGNFAFASAAGMGYYDRLGAGNLRGYSPQLMAIQSQLNARRPPGAPRLIESGKLDYATLSYPSHGMRFDYGNLEKRLREQQAWVLSRALGRKVSAAELTPELLKKAGPAAAGFARREEALKRAAELMRQFDAAALAAQDPDKITRQLLVDLGGKQREAARWLLIASLEEEVQRLEAEEAFMTAELRAAIEACPVAPVTKQSYARRGEGYARTLSELKGQLQKALAVLYAPDWSARAAEAERLAAAGAQKRKDVPRYARDYVQTAYNLAVLQKPQPRWRQIVDELVMKWLPSTSQGQALLRRHAQKKLLVDVFEKIAAGDLEAAHTVLASSGMTR